MSDERRPSGLGARPSTTPEEPSERPSRVGLGSSAPASAPSVKPPAPPPSTAPASALRGDSQGPLPQLMRLEVPKVLAWYGSVPNDHLAFLDIPKSHRFTTQLAEVQSRAKERKRQLMQWDTSNDQERQSAASAALRVLPQLEAAVASEASLAAWHSEFGAAKLLEQARDYHENDGRIDESEYQVLLKSAESWRVDAGQVLSVIRKVQPDFEPPKTSAGSRKKSSAAARAADDPAKPPSTAAAGKTWSPLVGRFRSTPSSQPELLQAMALEVPVAQELLFDKMLSFYLSQQGAVKLLQTADRIVRDYDRRESLGVWDFLWTAGYRNLHLVGTQPVDSLPALLAACGGRTEPIQDAIRSGQLALWAEKVAHATDLAKLVKTHRNSKPAELREAARRALWWAGDHRLQLSTGAVVSSLQELSQTMLVHEGHAKAAVAEMRSGAMDQWLRSLGLQSIADTLATVVRNRTDVYIQYALVWSFGLYRSLPLWQSSGETLHVERPADLGALSLQQLPTVVRLLDESILQAWASSVVKSTELLESWETMLTLWGKSPIAFRVAMLRWSVGASGILTAGGLIRTLPELFQAFESRPAEIEQCYADGVIDAWCRGAGFAHDALVLPRVLALPPPLRARAYLWCFGYPVLVVGATRVSTLRDLAALPDAEQQALQELIQCGAVALWRDVRFPSEASTLSQPIDAELALWAVGAPQPQLQLSVQRIDLGLVPESSVQRGQIRLAATGTRGRLSVALSADTTDIALESGGRHWTPGTPLVVGPMWALSGVAEVVNVEITIRPGAAPGGTLCVNPIMGGVPVNVPITWTPKFPMGAVWLAGLVGAVGAGVGAVMSRLILGVGLNDVLYYRPGTDFSNTAVPMLSRNLDAVSSGDMWKVGSLPGTLISVVLAWVVMRAARKTSTQESVALSGCLTFFLGGPLVALVVGYFLVYFCLGIDMVGHRLRALVGSDISLDGSAVLGWAFVFATLGMAMGVARVLKQQARTWPARAVVASPFVLFALLLDTGH